MTIENRTLCGAEGTCYDFKLRKDGTLPKTELSWLSCLDCRKLLEGC